jgi:hypothetical protein
MLNGPVGERLLRGEFRRRQRAAAGLQHAQIQTVRWFVVEPETEEAETNDRTKLAGQTPKERVAIVIGPQSLRHADERFITRDH